MKMMRTPLKSLPLLIALSAVAIFFSPHTELIYAQSAKELELRFNALRAQLAELQTRIGKHTSTDASEPLASAAIPSTFRFYRDLKIGAEGEDVRYLQALLNTDPDTRISTPGSENEYFGRQTRAGVIRFQNKYASGVLYPAGLKSATGTVGRLTRAKLNGLITNAIAAAGTVREESSVGRPAIIASSTAEASKTVSFDSINTATRSALVNILCTTKRSGLFNPFSGSGIFIDPNGVILTNAHVAEYILLKDYLVKDFVECTIRTGEPARNAYRAKLLYISPLWIQENASLINADEPTETGENDFALLLVTGSTNPENPLPQTFPYLALDEHTNAHDFTGEVLIAGYPASFLSGISIQKELYPATSVVPIGKVFGFSELIPDLFSVGGSLLAQKGSSGGAVVSDRGKLLGIIVTSTDATTTGERDLRAITVGHIQRSFKKDTGRELRDVFTSDAAASSADFNRNVAPALTELLEKALLRRSQ